MCCVGHYVALHCLLGMTLQSNDTNFCLIRSQLHWLTRKGGLWNVTADKGELTLILPKEVITHGWFNRWNVGHYVCTYTTTFTHHSPHYCWFR